MEKFNKLLNVRNPDALLGLHQIYHAAIATHPQTIERGFVAKHAVRG